MANPPASPMATPVPWDLVSSAYTEEVVPQLEAYARDAFRLAAVPPGARVVDVACGPGTLALLAAGAGHPVDALDFSPEMIAKLEARARTIGAAGVTAVVGDGQALPYADAQFGAAFSLFGVMFFPDRAAGLRELRRVLVPGARAVITTWQPLGANPVLSAMFGALRAALAQVTGAPQPAAQEMPLATADQCRAEMAEAFADVEVHDIAHVQSYASAEEAWCSLERTMARLVMLRRGLGEDRWAVVRAAGRDAVVAAVGSGPASTTMRAWATVGTAR